MNRWLLENAPAVGPACGQLSAACLRESGVRGCSRERRRSHEEEAWERFSDFILAPSPVGFEPRRNMECALCFPFPSYEEVEREGMLRVYEDVRGALREMSPRHL